MKPTVNRRATRQPQGNLRIDKHYGCPSVVALPSSGYFGNLVNNKGFTKTGTPYLEAGAPGMGYKLDETSYLALDTGLYSDTFTILVVWERLTTNQTTLWCSALTEGVASKQEVTHHADGHFYLVASGSSVVLGSTDVITSNEVHAAVIVCDNTRDRGVIYIDGKLQASYTGAHVSWNTTDSPYLGRRDSAQQYVDDHRNYLFAKWNYALPDQQALKLSRNPWQIFAQPASPVFGYTSDLFASPSLGRDIEQLEGGTASLGITPQVSSLKEAEALVGSLSLTIAKSGALADVEQLTGAVSLVAAISGTLKETEQLDGAASLVTPLSGSLLEAEQLPGSIPDFYDLLALSGFFNEIEQLPGANPSITLVLSGALAEAEQLPGATISSAIALSGTFAEAERLGGYRSYIYIPLPVEGILREIERCCGEQPVVVLVRSERILIEFPSDSVLLEQAPDQVLVELIF
jgi:hypothetical protein